MSRSSGRDDRAMHRRRRRQSLRDAVWPESVALREEMSRALSNSELPQRASGRRKSAEPVQADEPSRR